MSYAQPSANSKRKGRKDKKPANPIRTLAGFSLLHSIMQFAFCYLFSNLAE